MKKCRLTQQYVKELFDYDPRGYLIRKKLLANNRVKIGDIAGCYCQTGYYRVMIDRRFYSVHSIIFLWHHGYIPEQDIDHIDKNSKNNKIENLREVSRQCNILNSKMFSTNRSGIRGVCRDNNRNKWSAKIKINGSVINLGRFDELVEAAAHRLAVEQCLGFDSCEISSASIYLKEFIKDKDAKEI